MIHMGLSPNMVHVGSLKVTWHSFFGLLSIVLAYYLTVRWARSAGIADGVIQSVGLWAILGGMLGARVVHVADQWGYYSANPGQIVAVWNGGIAIWGAVFGGVMAGSIYAARKGFPIARILDLTAPALILAQAVGRIGDIINGEHFSGFTNLPWAVVYTNPDSPGFGRAPSHPAVAYEMLADLALFALLWVLRGRLRTPGALFAVYAAVYSVIRFSLSFIRYDSHSSLLGLNQQGYLSIPVFVAAVVALVVLLRSHDERAQGGGLRRELA